MIDRIAPTRRPELPVAGYQRWRSLLFLHWPVSVESLRPHVPSQLSLDLFDGVAYVGIVPFVMKGVRPSWLPEPLSFSFLETNVRTYVHFQQRPGVYFFSLDAASRLAVQTARWKWGLPYHYAHMHIQRNGDKIVYESQRAASAARLSVRYRLGDEMGPSPPGTVEHFLLERYLLFVQRHGKIYTGQVHHSPYPAQRAHLIQLRDELIGAAGLPQPSGHPALVHYAWGVDVEVFALRLGKHG